MAEYGHAIDGRQRRRRRRSAWKALTIVGAGVAGGGLAALVAYGVATAPAAVSGRASGSALDPEVVGRLEQRAWVAYYYRQWPTLFDLLLRLTRSQLNLSLPGALYAAYLATRAQVVFARQGDRDRAAEALMRRFYAYVRESSGGQYDPGRAAEREIRWWVVHRHRDDYPDRSALTEALAADYAEIYQVPVERVVAAADARAEAMDLSDCWNREGKVLDSPLLGQIADLLVSSYRWLPHAAPPPG